jgi:hypothetical protein
MDVHLTNGGQIHCSTEQQVEPMLNASKPTVETSPRLEPLAYRINDAERVSGISRSGLYNLIKEGKLHSIVVAGRRLIPADALKALLSGAE